MNCENYHIQLLDNELKCSICGYENIGLLDGRLTVVNCYAPVEEGQIQCSMCNQKNSTATLSDEKHEQIASTVSKVLQYLIYQMDIYYFVYMFFGSL